VSPAWWARWSNCVNMSPKCVEPLIWRAIMCVDGRVVTGARIPERRRLMQRTHRFAWSTRINSTLVLVAHIHSLHFICTHVPRTRASRLDSHTHSLSLTHSLSVLLNVNLFTCVGLLLLPTGKPLSLSSPSFNINAISSLSTQTDRQTRQSKTRPHTYSLFSYALD